MFDQATRFLLDVFFGLFTYAFLLRFAMQWLRVPFRNPLAQSVVALTDWAVTPVRRFVGAYKGLDASTLLLAWLSQFLWLASVQFLTGPATFNVSILTVLALMACIELVKVALWLLIIVVFAQAILTWVAPDGPFAGVLNALTFRFLTPIRRRVPLVGGTLDLSPLILIVILQLILMLPVRWLENAVLTLFR